MDFLKKGDEIKLRVEKLVNQGLGLARHEGEFPVFIKNVCTDDVITAKITHLTRSYANADLISVEEPSSYRVKPFCAMHNACGGCQWQFIEYEQQLKEKTQIVQETIQKISGLEIQVKPAIASPDNKIYRYKIQMPVQQTKSSKRFLIGYYKENSHELVNIKHCSIQPDYINKITEHIREKAAEYGITAYDERSHNGELRHIVFRASSSENNCIVVLVINAKKASEPLKKLARELLDTFNEVLGVCVNYNDKRTNTIMSTEMSTLAGQDFYMEKLENITYKISANSFFQVNPPAAVNIFKTVKEMIQSRTEKPTILDAYCGVASFGIWLKDIASEVYCVEESKSSVKDAQANIELNHAQNFQVFQGDAKNIFEQFISDKKTFDVVILDPPRKGCSQKALDHAIKLSERYIIYVSCNPATLARDLKYLDENGFRTNYIQPVDMFCHTHHIESVVLIEK